MKLKVKAMREGAKLPTRGTELAGGLDLYCHFDVLLKEHPEKIPTGIAIEIPAGYVGLIQTRSSSALNNITVFTTVVDADYRGELFITAKSDSIRLVTKGQRIAQLVLLPLPMFEPEWAEELSETKRGTGGYGSTGS
ncbi:MAG: dUTP diphosphatase [Lachnospiraceae bacterium]|nr:dUTP diphosphatase [Lachnospiraceae bacterium]